MQETDVELPSGGDLCRAWFFVPDDVDPPVACIVMGHGFGLTRRCGLREVAVSFAEAGYAVLLFDYRGFGDSAGLPRQVVSFRKQLQDWSAAIDYARSRPEVDASRVITWGFSLGAGHALTAANRDPQVAAVVSVMPMFDGLSSTLAAMRRWSVPIFFRVVVRALWDLIVSAAGRPRVTVPVSARPGELGLLTSPDARVGYEALVPGDFDYELGAGIALLFWTYVPGLALRRFRRQLLVFFSPIDKVNPAGPTLRRVRRCPSATLVALECEHMEALQEPHRRHVVQAATKFLDSRLLHREVE